MTGRPTPRLILLCGLPGSGKTTLAKHLGGQLSAVRLCGDEWMARLGITLHDEQARDRIEVQFWLLAQDLLRLGQSVILESGFWLRSDRDEKRLGARVLGVAVHLQYLDVPPEELWRRLELRNQSSTWAAVPISREQLEYWSTLFEVPDQLELDLFDSVELGPARQ
ncbi:MAG: AAA family ATPase [Candidatus Dormiibacterota bacterium]